MKQYLVDTDVIIDVGRNIPDAIKSFELMMGNGKVYISQMSQMELLIWCRNKSEQKKLNIFLNEFEIIPIDNIISNNATDLLISYRLSHNLLIGDSIIAATSISRNLLLLSKNQKDYKFINNINLLKYPLNK